MGKNDSVCNYFENLKSIIAGQADGKLVIKPDQHVHFEEEQCIAFAEKSVN